MATGKTYYWMRLKISFMDSDTVDFFMSQPDGANYVVLYQMLCLKTINTDGRLSRQIGEVIIPYDVEKIRRDCKWFSSDTIRVALELYKKFGLIYEDVDGTLVLADHHNLVGKATDYADQKKAQRLKNSEKPRLPEGEGVDNVHTDVHTEIRDIESRDVEIRDKSLEIEVKGTGSNEPVCRTGDVRRIMAAWNESGLTQVARITADTNRGKMLKARIREYGVDGVLKAIENVKNSSFLKGQNNRGFEATFDWFVKPNNFLKVFEGNYADTASATGAASACSHDGEAYQIALYLAQQKALDNPGRAQPTEAELQKQAEILNTLHLENGVEWKAIDDTLYYALESSWWNKKVQSAYDLKLHFNSIFADMVRDQGAVKE